MRWGQAWSDTGYVFTRENGEPFNPDSVSSRFRDVVERSNLPRIRLHDARHTWPTLALENGVPLKVVSEQLGHASIAVTADIYSHVSPTMSANAVETVANAILGDLA